MLAQAYITALCSLPSTLTAKILMTTDTVLCHITYSIFQSDICNKCVSDVSDFREKEDDLLVFIWTILMRGHYVTLIF
jgi:hypothetical protein